MKKAKSVFSNLGFAVRYVFRFKKSYIFVSLFMSLMSIIGPVTEIWGQKKIVDMLVADSPVTEILILIGIITALELLKMLLFNTYNSFYLPMAKCGLQSSINLELFQKPQRWRWNALSPRTFLTSTPGRWGKLTAGSYPLWTPWV